MGTEEQMAHEPAKSIEKIKTICEERQQIEVWLERLAQSADTAPDHVKQRVEADYRQRLGEVLAELRTHRDEVSEALEGQRIVRDGLKGQESEETERLAEAELRYTVGEFDDTKWSETKANIEQSRAKISNELVGVEQELGELEEVMELIEGGPSPGREETAVDEAPLPELAAVESDTALSLIHI